MIIQEVYIVGVAVHESEDNSPVCPNCHGVEAFQLALERMKVKVRAVHILYPRGRIQVRQDSTDAIQLVLRQLLSSSS